MSNLRIGLAVATFCWGCASGDLRVVSTETVPSAAVFVIAARQKTQIENSLHRAGIALAEDITNAAYLLRVTIGNEKGWRECGTLNNVKFALRRNSEDIVLITGSGWTGDCNPTIFDRVSKALRDSFSAPVSNQHVSNQPVSDQPVSNDSSTNEAN